MKPKTYVLVSFALFVVAACTDATPASPGSGISGIALAGPRCPVVVAESPCPDTPWSGTVRVVEADGTVVAETRTDAQGRFEVPVPPGTYSVLAGASAGPGSGAVHGVRVIAGRITSVDLTVDTGIR